MKSMYAIGILFLGLAVGLTSCLPTPISQTPTETSSPQIPTETFIPSATAVPSTLTPPPTYTMTPMPGEFAVSIEGWGEYPENMLPQPGVNVNQYCNSALPIRHEGNCSLEFRPLQITNGNAYVARYADPSDVKAKISIFVYTPSAELCSGSTCSTARLIIWDKNFTSHESEEVILSHVGDWVEITLDLSGTEYPQPYQAIGVHFYLATQYDGPLYIDSVSITSPN